MTVMRCATHQRNHTVFGPCPECQTDVPEYAVPEDRRKGDRRVNWPVVRPGGVERRNPVLAMPIHSRLIHLGLLLSAHVQEGNMKEARAVAKAFDEQLDSIKEG